MEKMAMTFFQTKTKHEWTAGIYSSMFQNTLRRSIRTKLMKNTFIKVTLQISL